MFYHLQRGLRLGGVIFDMDGTLTKPAIDFAKMRQRLQIKEGDVLRVIESYSDEKKKAEAHRIIEEIEKEARENLELQPGLHELMDYLDLKEMKRAIVTRNNVSAVQHFLDTIGRDIFHLKITRDSPFPAKPHPAAVEYICQEWRLKPSEVMFVGDFRDDMLCGRSAGTTTCLLLSSDKHKEFEHLADITINRLDELVNHLEEGFHVHRNLNQEKEGGLEEES